MKRPTSDAGSRCLLSDSAGHAPSALVLVATEPGESPAKLGVLARKPRPSERERDETGGVPVAARRERGAVGARPLTQRSETPPAVVLLQREHFFNNRRLAFRVEHARERRRSPQQRQAVEQRLLIVEPVQVALEPFESSPGFVRRRVAFRRGSHGERGQRGSVVGGIVRLPRLQIDHEPGPRSVEIPGPRLRRPEVVEGHPGVVAELPGSCVGARKHQGVEDRLGPACLVALRGEVLPLPDALLDVREQSPLGRRGAGGGPVSQVRSRQRVGHDRMARDAVGAAVSGRDRPFGPPALPLVQVRRGRRLVPRSLVPRPGALRLRRQGAGAGHETRRQKPCQQARPLRIHLHLHRTTSVAKDQCHIATIHACPGSSNPIPRRDAEGLRAGWSLIPSRPPPRASGTARSGRCRARATRRRSCCPPPRPGWPGWRARRRARRRARARRSPA